MIKRNLCTYKGDFLDFLRFSQSTLTVCVCVGFSLQSFLPAALPLKCNTAKAHGMRACVCVCVSVKSA